MTEANFASVSGVGISPSPLLLELILIIESLGALFVSDGTLAIPVALLLFYLLLVAIPLVVGILALLKLKKSKSRSEITAISIITLIFCSIIAGIIMLCMKDKDLQEKQ